MVHEVLGAEPEVITGAEEAALSFTGAVGSLDVPSDVLVADIGGGSTELVRGGAPLRSWSMDVGCVRMTERHLHDDPPTPAQVDAVVRDLHAALDAAAQHVAAGCRRGAGRRRRHGHDDRGDRARPRALRPGRDPRPAADRGAGGRRDRAAAGDDPRRARGAAGHASRAGWTSSAAARSCCGRWSSGPARRGDRQRARHPGRDRAVAAGLSLRLRVRAPSPAPSAPSSASSTAAAAGARCR